MSLYGPEAPAADTVRRTRVGFAPEPENMRSVDVIVVNYNGGAYLARAIGALQAQVFRDFRIIVVDNDSDDGSVDLLPESDIPMQIVRSPHNIGFAAANNLALLTCVSAPWVALLNPDAFPDPEWLDSLVSASRQHPTFSGFGCHMRAADDSRRLDGVGDVYHLSGLYWREGHGCSDSAAFSTSHEIFSPCAAAALYRASDLRLVGGFDEDFFCYGEDVDLGFRLRLCGKRFLYVPAAKVAHVGSGLTGVDSDFAIYHGHRNLVWTYVKNVPGILFWVCLPVHLLMNMVALGVFAGRGRGRVLWRAKIDAVRGLPRVWAKRRSVQEQRRATVRAIWRVMNRGLARRRCPTPPPAGGV